MSPRRNYGALPTWLHRVIRVVGLWQINLEGTMTWWASDDVHHRERKFDIEVKWPAWVLRPYCWWQGGCDEHYGCCAYCHKPFKSSPYYRKANRR